MKSSRRQFMQYAGTGLMMLNSPLGFAKNTTSNGLSLAQSKTLAYLWNYEKMQADVLAELSSRFPTLKLYETFTKFSKISQKGVLEELIKLYQIDITDTSEGLIAVSETQLRNMPRGDFGLTALTASYNSFVSEGSSSKKDALLVGAKTVVKEIDKMNSFINLFTSQNKIKESLEFMQGSSMGQYWSINHELKVMGVLKGCCEAGTQYCKTQDNYPISYGHNDYNSGVLSDTQKHSLAHMWSEEKMAHDAYMAAYSVYPDLRLFYNIGHWSEGQHMLAVEELAALFDIDLDDYTNTDSHYDKSKLRAKPSGKFVIDTFESKYSSLLGKAVLSKKDALQVGCLAEVQDIRDLTKFLGQNTGNKYIEETFKYLISGSQSHYWSFHYALKAMGVSGGCCSQGDDYCKTAKQYPMGSGDLAMAKRWNQQGSSLDQHQRLAHLAKFKEKTQC